jgi:hypothetical protein
MQVSDTDLLFAAHLPALILARCRSIRVVRDAHPWFSNRPDLDSHLVVKLCGSQGILLSNDIVFFGALAVSALCRGTLGGIGGWAGLLCLATPSAVGWDILVYHVVDLAAVLPICAAFLVWQIHPGLSGLPLGVQGIDENYASTDRTGAPPPAGPVGGAEIRDRCRCWTGSRVVFAASNPSAFFNNVVLYQSVRPCRRP